MALPAVVGISPTTPAPAPTARRPPGRLATLNVTGSGAQRADGCLYFAVFGEAPDVVLGEDQPPVGPHVKDAAAAADQLGIDAELSLEGRGQPGRAREVVSGHTPGDGDLHGHFVLGGTVRGSYQTRNPPDGGPV